jgi:hypothetical protein
MRPHATPPGSSFSRAACCALLLLAAPACTRTPIEDSKITAADTTEFFRWKRDAMNALSPERQRQLESTIEELRLDIMFKREASGHDAIEAAVCQRLNNLTVKQALLLGAQTKWQRLAAERDDLQRVINANAHLITKPGDETAALDLGEFRAKQQQRLDADARELPALEREIHELGGPPPVFQSTTPATQPTAVTRAEALRQIDDLLQSRRNSAAGRYGPWPVKIDWEGTKLEGALRAEFLAKKSAGGGNGKVVIPVRLKNHWLLFEAPDQAPVLPEDVRAQLSAGEVGKFKHDWLEVEAELWAREAGKDFPTAPTANPEAEPLKPPVLPPR